MEKTCRTCGWRLKEQAKEHNENLSYGLVYKFIGNKSLCTNPDWTVMKVSVSSCYASKWTSKKEVKEIKFQQKLEQKSW